jgi:type IV pilus assembly protein PilE
VVAVIDNIRINDNHGFTLIELMIVVAILGILAAIAYPSYQGYIERGHRTDMMSEMHNIASTIESRKLAQGKYNSVVTTDLVGNYPQNEALYTVAISPNPLSSTWTITATPIPSKRMKNDKIISLDYRGYKCRDTTCGTGDEWK